MQSVITCFEHIIRNRWKIICLMGQNQACPGYSVEDFQPIYPYEPCGLRPVSLDVQKYLQNDIKQILNIIYISDKNGQFKVP